MTPGPGPTGPRARGSRRLWWCLAAAVLLARAACLAKWGSELPFQDQWGAEGALVVAPALDGTLEVSALLARHGEHVILFSRLAALAGLGLTGAWDATWGQLLTAALAAALTGVVGARLARGLRLERREELLLAGAALLLLATPIAWESILGGLQSSALFCALFGAAALAAHAELDRPDELRQGGARRALALLLVACALASFAAGALLGAALVAAAYLATPRAGAPGRRTAWAAFALTAAFAATTPLVERAAPTAPRGAGELVAALADALAWPARTPSLALQLALACLWWAPAALLARRAWRGELAPALRPGARLALGLAAWSALVAVAAAAARGRDGGATASRYTELLALGALANVAAASLLARLDGRPLVRAAHLARAALLAVCLVALLRPAAAHCAHRWLGQREQLRLARACVDGADVSDVDTSLLWGISVDEVRRAVTHPATRPHLPWSLRPVAGADPRAGAGAATVVWELPAALPVEAAPGRATYTLDRARKVVVVEADAAGWPGPGPEGRGPVAVTALEVAWFRARSSRHALSALAWLAALAGPALLVCPRLRRGLRRGLRRRAGSPAQP